MRAPFYFIAGLSLAALLNGCDHGPAAAPDPSAPGTAAVAPAAAPVADDINARAAVEQFYTLHLREDAAGVPDESQMAAYRPFLSQRLLGQLAHAARERDEAIAAHPDEKPPFVDGDLFTSLFEGANSFEVGVPSKDKDGRLRVPVKFSHAEPGTPPERWTDVALLTLEDNHWKLDDVEYHGDWDFATQGRLSAILQD